MTVRRTRVTTATSWDRSLVVILLLVAAPAVAADPAVPPASAEIDLPELPAIREAVAGHFAAISGRDEGDLLTRQDVVPLFGSLARLGWTVADEKDILAQILPDNDPLASQLRTPAGTKFMRRVATIPQGFDRIDRLRRLPDGARQLNVLIKGPDGHKMIEYMATTTQGANLGRSLSRTSRGDEFNKATSRLYTAADVLKRLEQSYAVELARRTTKSR